MVFAQHQQDTSTLSTAAVMVTSRSRCFLRKKMFEVSWWSIKSVIGSIKRRGIKWRILGKARRGIEKRLTHTYLVNVVYLALLLIYVFYTLKMYLGKNCGETIIEHIKTELKRLYSTFPQQPMAGLTDVLKKEH